MKQPSWTRISRRMSTTLQSALNAFRVKSVRILILEGTLPNVSRYGLRHALFPRPKSKWNKSTNQTHVTRRSETRNRRVSSVIVVSEATIKGEKAQFERSISSMFPRHVRTGGRLGDREEIEGTVYR